MKTSFQVLLVASLASLSAGQDNACQLCPAGSTMTLPENPIPSNLFDTQGFDISTCGAIDTALGLLAAISPDLCSSTIQPFLDAFAAQYYCGCTEVADPAVECSVCDTLSPEAEVFVVPEGPFANFTCGEADRFFDSILDQANCDTGILALLCCPALPPQTEVPASDAPASDVPSDNPTLTTMTEAPTEPAATEPAATEAPVEEEVTTDAPTEAPAERSITMAPTVMSSGPKMAFVANMVKISLAIAFAAML